VVNEGLGNGVKFIQGKALVDTNIVSIYVERNLTAFNDVSEGCKVGIEEDRPKYRSLGYSVRYAEWIRCNALEVYHLTPLAQVRSKPGQACTFNTTVSQALKEKFMIQYVESS
jgi:hypothetical protein